MRFIGPRPEIPEYVDQNLFFLKKLNQGFQGIPRLFLEMNLISYL